MLVKSQVKFKTDGWGFDPQPSCFVFTYQLSSFCTTAWWLWCDTRGKTSRIFSRVPGGGVVCQPAGWTIKKRRGRNLLPHYAEIPSVSGWAGRVQPLVTDATIPATVGKSVRAEFSKRFFKLTFSSFSDVQRPKDKNLRHIWIRFSY